ncbi:MAG: CPBP family intramembrane glutamic endopeptidase [Candidatus Thermoplasmatota archaeon]
MHIKEIARSELAEFLKVRWKPERDLLIVLCSYIALVATMFTAFEIVTSDNVAPYFILYGFVTILLIGVVVPLAYTVLVRKRPLSEVGITKKYWIASLVLGAILGLVTYQGTLAQDELPVFEELMPLVMVAFTVGLFEAVFFRGWAQLAFERSFGAMPAVLIGSAMYSLYHIGYGMEASELMFLFVLGVTFALAFRATRNVLVLWPLYTWVGGLHNNVAEGLTMDFGAVYGFTIVLVLILMSIAAISRRGRKLAAGSS